MMDLQENRADMMIGIAPSQSSDIQFRRLGQLHFIPVAAKDYIKTTACRTRITSKNTSSFSRNNTRPGLESGTAGSTQSPAGASLIPAMISSYGMMVKRDSELGCWAATHLWSRAVP